MTISNEAVEAAAKWLHDNDCRSAAHSGLPADIECYDWLDEARELLEAAAPTIRAEALEEAAKIWHHESTVAHTLRARAVAERGSH